MPNESAADAPDPDFSSQHATIIVKLKTVLAKIKRIHDVGRAALSNADRVAYFCGVAKEAKNYYDNFNRLWDTNIELHSTFDKLESFPSDGDRKFMDEADQYYFDILYMHDKVNPPTPTPIARSTLAPGGSGTSTVGASLSVNNETGSRSRLPKINLIKFSGDFTQWPLFRDSFLSMVHEDTGVSDIEKFHHLISSLEGDSLQLIKDIPVQASQYGRAWQAILDNYDNKRLLSNHYLSKVLDFRAPSGKPTLSSLKGFLTNVGESIAAFKRLDIQQSEEHILFSLAIRSLDPHTRQAFERKYVNVEFPTFNNLDRFVRDECRTLELAGGKTDPPPQHPKERYNRATLLVNNDTHSKEGLIPESKNCPVCKKPHVVMKCGKFRHLSPRERFNSIKFWSGCKLCLESSHSTQKCQSEKRCGKCDKRHHTWLHFGPSSPSNQLDSSAESPSPSSNSQPAAVLLGGSKHPVDVLLGTVSLKIKDACGHLQQARAIVDGGSEYSFITEACRGRLGLPLGAFDKTLCGLGESNLCKTRGLVDCRIHSPSTEYSTRAVVVTSITGYLPHCSLPPSFTNKLKGYLLADPAFTTPGPIDFLLGADLFYDILMGSPITLCDNMPKLVPTAFGHVVAGRCEGQSAGRVFLAQQSQELNEIMSKFWTVEEVGDVPIISKEDQFCETFFENTTYRTETGRYVVALPFKNSIVPDLSASKMLATKRFHNLESKLAKSSEFSKAYKDFMEEYEELQHMEIAQSPAKFVIPHHGVWKNEGDSGKIRVVFDGSCQTNNGSLNSHLLTGPKLQRGVDEVILRFRQHSVVFSADIVKHYRQILVRPEDRPYQHIMWRTHPGEQLQEYQLNTITYGLSCSPWLALRAVKQLVIDEGANFPLAADVLTHAIFVDDIVSGCATVSEAIEIQGQLRSMLAKGGFELSKWSSNCDQLLEVLDSTSTRPLQFDSEGDTFIKILGLQWDPTEDTFRYKIRSPALTTTKRGISSAIARIYDPLGYLSPVVFYAKVLLQACWQAKVDWDDPVPQDIEAQWQIFVAELPKLNSWKIPRQIPTACAHKIQLIGFCDGSQRGYSAVIYVRLDFLDKVEIHLLKGKTGVAPIRPLTVPRLELQAALLLSRLFVSIKDYLTQVSVDEFFWFSDSMLVLGWLKTPPNLLKSYVGHRIVKITDRTNMNDWYHVSSPDNPSDCSSRGILPSEILNHPLWLHGPSWLYRDPSVWPKCTLETIEPPTDVSELRSSNLTMNTFQASFFIDWMAHFSSYGRLLRIMGYVLRALRVMVGWPNRKGLGRRSLKNPKSREDLKKTPDQTSRNPPSTLTPHPISSEEYHNANLVYIKIVQYYFILNGRPTTNLQLFPQLRRLNCFFDTLGLIRVGGRLQESTLPAGSKHPIVLPGKCHFTRLLIDHFHEQFYHMSPTALQCFLRCNYWILSARSVIKQRIHRCVVCIRAARQSPTPKMGNLPRARVDDGGVWQNVGVDYAGPFMVRFSNHRKGSCSKAYLCLFVCMATKALHLELVSDCSTEAFLATLDRFIGRRGLPHTIFSDCGKTFVGASTQLKELQAWLMSQPVQGSVYSHLAAKGIQWSFNPPYAPNFGGLWEAGVKSTKKILYKISSGITWTFEELTTLLVRIEAILNSRPLTPLSDNPTDLEYLTPGHFLVGKPLLARPERDVQEVPMNRLRRWQLVQRQVQHFWRRWRQEYLHHLQVRVKWSKDEPNVTEGTMVVLRDATVPPLHWQLGRVMKVFPGRDQTVRVVEVLTPTGRYTRKVSQVISLKSATEPDLA